MDNMYLSRFCLDYPAGFTAEVKQNIHQYKTPKNRIDHKLQAVATPEYLKKPRVHQTGAPQVATEKTLTFLHGKSRCKAHGKAKQPHPKASK